MLTNSKVVFGCMVLCVLVLHFSKIEAGENNPVLNFTCGTNGIKSIDTDHLEKVYILLNESTHVYCNPKNKNLKDCFETTNTDVPGELKVLYEEALTPHIVGGKQVHYFHLVCKDKPRVMNATASFSNITYYGNYTDTVKNIVIDGSLTLKISGNPDNHDNTDNIKDVEVGQSLYLFLSGPAEHKISPKECTAKSLTMNNPEEVPLWKTNALCDDFDPNIIDQKWTTKTDKLSIRMYAFRFDSSDEVTITCTAFVCSVSDQSPNCTQVCVNSQQHNSVRRRRNAIVGPQLQHAEKSASASFRIVKRDTSNAAAGMSSFSFVFLLFPAIIWM